jgi:solute:Na+ symporter, SSS family
MLIGLPGALIVPAIFPDIKPLYTFPASFGVSLIACVAGSLLTKPEDDETLLKFYTSVKPWRFWKPVLKMAREKYPEFKENKAFKRDLFNVMTGIIWQLSIIALPIYIVVQEQTSIIVSAGIFVICSLILHKTWYKKLEN